MKRDGDVSHLYNIYIYICVLFDRNYGKGSIDSAWAWIGLIFFFLMHSMRVCAKQTSIQSLLIHISSVSLLVALSSSQKYNPFDLKMCSRD